MQRAGHAEMQRQPAAAIDVGHKVLAVTAGGNELGALQAAHERLRSELAQDTPIAHDDPLDRLTQGIACEHAFESLDVGQFGHVTVRLLQQRDYRSH